jgi:hypothetical protein
VTYEERRLLGEQGTPAPGPQLSEAICMRMTWKLDTIKPRPPVVVFPLESMIQ